MLFRMVSKHYIGIGIGQWSFRAVLFRMVSKLDTFIRESEVLELLPFDNSLSPNGGSTLTYGYIQKKLPSATSFRAINEEYSASQATVEKKSVDLKIFGGSFELDRVIKQAEGMYNNMALQLEEKVISAVGTFHNAMIKF